MTIDQLKTATPPLHGIAVWSDNQHPLKANFAHTLGELLQARLIKGLTRLIRAVLDQLIRQFLHLLARPRLLIDHLIDGSRHIGLPAPSDPLAASGAHR
jgi:hypothetical protein